MARRVMENGVALPLSPNPHLSPHKFFEAIQPKLVWHDEKYVSAQGHEVTAEREGQMHLLKHIHTEGVSDTRV